MTPAELLQRLQDHEDGFIERKPPGVNREELRRTGVAFANSVPDGRVAILFIGIDDDGNIRGVKDTDSLQKTVRRALEVECYPPIRYQSEVLRIDSLDILAVCIPPSSNKPHFSGPAYVRVGSESRSASEQMFEELVLSRNDKSRELLKHKNQVISVITHRKRLGDTRPVSDSQYTSYCECRIVECNAHYVRFYIISRGTYAMEPLQNLTIAYDEERYRLLLLIDPR